MTQPPRSAGGGGGGARCSSAASLKLNISVSCFSLVCCFVKVEYRGEFLFFSFDARLLEVALPSLLAVIVVVVMKRAARLVLR
jgi:hypothetical protein